MVLAATAVAQSALTVSRHRIRWIGIAVVGPRKFGVKWAATVPVVIRNRSTTGSRRVRVMQWGQATVCRR